MSISNVLLNALPDLFLTLMALVPLVFITAVIVILVFWTITLLTAVQRVHRHWKTGQSQPVVTDESIIDAAWRDAPANTEQTLAIDSYRYQDY